MDDENDSFNEDRPDEVSPQKGFMVFMDAENDQQYAFYVDARRQIIKAPMTFSGKGARLPVRPTNRIAIEEDSVHFVKEAGAPEGKMVAAVLYLNDTEIVQGAVTYDYTLSINNYAGKDYYDVEYTLLDDSIEALTEAGFPILPQKTYREKMIAEADVPVEDVFFVFPPHHREGTMPTWRTLDILADDPKKLTQEINQLPQVMKMSDLPKQDQTPQQNIPATQGQVPAAPAKKAPTVPDSVLRTLLEKYSEDMTAKAAAGEYGPFVGMEEDVRFGIKVMNSRDQSWACFTGESGAGKSARMEAIALELYNSQNLPERLENARVLKLNIAKMVEGAKYRGQFEELLGKITQGLMERDGWLGDKRIIIALDEIQNQLTVGATSDSANSAGDMMKDFLNTLGVSGMATSTKEEYEKYIARDKALKRRIREKQIDEPDYDTTKLILKARWPAYKEYHHMAGELTDDQMDIIVTKTNRAQPNAAQPDKSLKALDLACSQASMERRDTLNNEDILQAVAENSGLSLAFLKASTGENLIRLAEHLPEQILGQDNAMTAIIDALMGSAAGLSDPRKPRAAFILQGPTRTGKTETARQVAKFLYGDENAVLRIDMAEYQEAHTVSNLIGSPNGYVDSDKGGKLTEAVRRRPHCVILLDEIEKAHKDVFNILLAILDNGQISDRNNNIIKFQDTIIMMTSNAGASTASKIANGDKLSAGFLDDEVDRSQMLMTLKNNNQTAISKIFPPEAVNRVNELGGILYYESLDAFIIRTLVEREIADLEKRFNSPTGANLKNIKLHVTPEYIETLSGESFDPVYNAGPVKRVIRQQLINPLSKWLLIGEGRGEIEKFLAENGGAQITLDVTRDNSTDNDGNLVPEGTPLPPVIGKIVDPTLAQSFHAVNESNDNEENKATPLPQEAKKYGTRNTRGPRKT